MVVELHVREHRDLDLEAEHRAVGLVRLDHQPLPSLQWSSPARRPPSRPPASPGPSPAARSACTIIDEVVVLPWVPATAIVRRSALSSPSSAARGRSGMPRSRGGCALDVLSGDRRGVDELDVGPSGTFSAVATDGGEDPVPRSRSRYSLSAPSDPLTLAPSACAALAYPLMPAPPTPDEVDAPPAPGAPARASAPQPAAAQQLRATSSAASGRASEARRPPPSPSSRSGSAERSADGLAAEAGRSAPRR